MAKCLVKNCTHHSNDEYGKFIQFPGDYHVQFICASCWEFIITAKSIYKNSTICQNAKSLEHNNTRIKLNSKPYYKPNPVQGA